MHAHHERAIAHGVESPASDVGNLAETLLAIVRHPVEQKTKKVRRFQAQCEARHGYGHEASKRDARYPLGLAVARTVLFRARMILAHNEQLFLYHITSGS